MKKYNKWVISSILISILSIVLILVFTLDTTTTAVIKDIRPGYILAALVIHIFSFIIWGLRIKSMTGALGHKIGLLRSFEIVVSGTFVAALTPSSIGGEPLRIHFLMQDQMPVGKATAVILGERVLDAILMSLFQNFTHTFFQHNRKHAISNNPLKTTLRRSYLLANFLNPIFNHAKNRSIVPL
ncbi:lysylphosphatidylglycerol synthase transmembrane domain-containing protein [uncultured Methanomethylovorans sp.]|uniref:lysylphosphatidylglycerol synthase transmembrane domain-containing protein n=1 Tax=uncultured Methanomethylovorans sp. TaxID=183759 RepID=UPI002AA75EF8|nr:lysylphosphatidylglycerol synthase transmembrane domain-containing protein [uncultured Methanomethylovorans sp.]